MILTEEQEMIRATAREFAEAELAPHAPEWDRNAEFPAEAVHRMGELGFLGMLVPEAWDGSNTGHVSYALALEEIAAGDGGCSTIMSVQNSVVNVPILNSGSREQKERFLRPLASGAMRGGFALTETAGRLRRLQSAGAGDSRRQPVHPLRNQTVHHVG